MRNEQNWKGLFINDLIRQKKYKKYLELGIGSGESWVEIECQYKIGVDSNYFVANKFNIINSTTDIFFERNNNKFDLIYIDALHEKTQVRKDFINSFNNLNNGGIIILHDINPLTFESTKQTSSGDVFEFWINLCNSSTVFTYTFSNGDTIGIFTYDDNLNFDIKKLENKQYSYEYFSLNRDRYVNNINNGF